MEDARNSFLDSIRKHVPQVLTELAALVPMYQAIPDDLRNECSSGPRLKRMTNNWSFLAGEPPEFEVVRLRNLLLWSNLVRSSSTSAPVETLRKEVWAWATRFHLSEEWLLDRSLQTLFTWSTFPLQQQGSLRWGGLPNFGLPAAVTLSERSLNIQLTDQGWVVEHEPWKDFQKRVIAQVDAQLSSYRQRLLESAKAHGWNTVSVRGPKHFDWLALFQCGRCSPKEIARRLQVQTKEAENIENTILVAVRQKADLIGLKLRAGNRGRPRKM